MQESGAGMQGQGPWQSTPRELAGWDPSNLRKTQWHQGWGNAKEDIQTCTYFSSGTCCYHLQYCTHKNTGWA